MLRVGVIGCGHWGKNYVRVFHELPAVRVVRVADKSEANLQTLGRRYPDIALCAEASEVIDDPTIQAVVIATEASTHYEMARRCLQRDKHILVEKPMALDPEECRELTEISAARQVTLMTGHIFLYNEGVRTVKQILDQEETGRVYYLTSQRNHLGMIRTDVNVLWDLAAHDISIFSHFLGESPSSVSACGGKYLHSDREDIAFVTLFFPSGVIGHLEVSWMDAKKVRQVVVITERRRIVFDDLDNMESVRVYEKGVARHPDAESFGEFQYLLRDGLIMSPKVDRREPLKSLARDFVHCVDTGASPLANGADGTQVVRVLAAADKSMRERGAEVPV